MRERVGALVAMLRREGAPVSVAEVMDAHEAIAVAGLERATLKEALAATLVKDHARREVFERAFLACFPDAPGEAPGERGAARQGVGAGERGEGEGAGKRRPPREVREAAPRETARETPREAREPRGATAREVTPRETAVSGAASASSSARRMARQAALMRQPFRTMPPEALGEVRELARELAQRLRRRWSRRWRAARRGRVDMRRTVRRAASRGGIPLALLRRHPRPSRPDLVALVDLSWSTRLASELMLSMLAPCERYFRRVEILGFVAEAVPVSLERGHLVPHAPLDLDAPSDTGRALAAFGASARRIRRDTLLLVLGDGRNNRNPSRAAELAKLRQRAGIVAWLAPEPRERWGTGDSAMPAYARHADAAMAVPDLASLAAALAAMPWRIARGRRALRDLGLR